MKKIIYISFLNEDLRPGYKKKIFGQVQAFTTLGYDAELIICGDDVIRIYKYLEQLSLYKEIPFKHKRLKRKRNPVDEFFNFGYFCNVVEKYLRESTPQYVYFRRIIPATYTLLRLIKKVKNMGIKIAYEYPTYPWKEEVMKDPTCSRTEKVYYYVDIFFAQFIDKYIDVIPFMGYYDGLDYRFTQLQNAGNERAYEFIGERESVNSEIHLIGVAHVNYWTGYDILIEELKKYYSLGNKQIVHFDIVGTIDPSLKIEQLVEESHLEKYVHFHGLKIGKELDEIFQTADIGVNVLRIDSKTRTLPGIATLKTVEYTFRGLPQIASLPFCVDGDKIDTPNFLFILDEHHSLASIIDQYCKEDFTRREIRNYAIEHMSWDKIMHKVIQKLEANNDN